jgi:hypothetical protein
MSFVPLLMAIAVILIFAGIVYAIIRTSRKSHQIKLQQLSYLGFQLLEEPHPTLQDRVEQVYRLRGKGEISLRDVYYRRELDQDLYIFDMINTSGDDSEMGTEVFGVISRELALPRFSITTLPGFSKEGLVGSMMDKLLDKVMDLAGRYQGFSRLEFPDQPGLDDRFVIFGQDEYALRELVSRISLPSLQQDSLIYTVAGSGDFLTVDFNYSSSAETHKMNLDSRYRYFRQIVNIFMD